VGILLYAQTSTGNRIATSTMLEIPTRAQPGTLPKQEVKVRERGAEVVRGLMKQLSFGGAMDEYLADQIVIFMALATSGANPPIAIERGVEETGKIRRCKVLVGKVSLHTETAMRIAEIMLGNIIFSTEEVDDGVVMVCEKKIE
jgi:RNA 3'-terminal phosphate cyclase